MITFSFVVLHYQTYQDTVDCVDSILSLDVGTNLIAIVVVNNGSSNMSGKELENRYLTNDIVHYINSDDNLGFAKGNNLGYQYAKYELKAKFICLINNDTLIRQPDFVQKIIDKYEKTKFHILGPDIISTIDNLHQNPQVETYLNRTVVKQKKNFYRQLLVLNYLGIELFVVGLKRKLKPVKANKELLTIDWKTEKYGLKLHGSCLIFSELYINKYQGLNPDTFMYCEESLLFHLVKQDQLVSCYFPEVQIFHKEDSSTNYQYPNDSNKRRFYYKNIIKSLGVLSLFIKKT